MKPVAIVLGALALMSIGALLFASSQKPAELEAVGAFLKFKQDFRRHYSTQSEHEFRFSVFAENLKKIQELQKKALTFTVGVNRFSDLTWEEFKNGYLSKEIPNKVHRKGPAVKDVDPIDWREKGAVTPVKDQGACGSCWAFSTTGSLEAYNFLKTGELVSLSEQELVDCSGEYGNYGCGGGLMSLAYDYILDHQGLYTEEAYPYKGYDDECQTVEGSKYAPQGYDVLEQEDVSEISERLAVNPVSVAIEVQYDFQSYTGGVYTPTDSDCGYGLNHGVMVVGQKDDYFIIKNSWGDSWGEEGYIRFAIGSGSGTCGIANKWDVVPK